MKRLGVVELLVTSDSGHHADKSKQLLPHESGTLIFCVYCAYMYTGVMHSKSKMHTCTCIYPLIMVL